MVLTTCTLKGCKEHILHSNLKRARWVTLSSTTKVLKPGSSALREATGCCKNDFWLWLFHSQSSSSAFSITAIDSCVWLVSTDSSTMTILNPHTTIHSDISGSWNMLLHNGVTSLVPEICYCIMGWHYWSLKYASALQWHQWLLKYATALGWHHWSLKYVTALGWHYWSLKYASALQWHQWLLKYATALMLHQKLIQYTCQFFFSALYLSKWLQAICRKQRNGRHHTFCTSYCGLIVVAMTTNIYQDFQKYLCISGHEQILGP